MIKFSTVKFWMEQLNDSGIQNTNNTYGGTKITYLAHLTRFSEWLPGHVFYIKVKTMAGYQKVVCDSIPKLFSNAEELLRFGEEDLVNEKEVKKIITQYLKDPVHKGIAHSTMNGICAAIKSYFDVHDVMTGIKYNGRNAEKAEVIDEPDLEPSELFKMLTARKADPLLRAVFLVKFQAGLDSSTLADRFNFYAYPQIAKWCGCDDYQGWDVNMCPIPIQLVRVKTDVKYTTFLDRDAIIAIRTYLSWKERYYGPHDPEGPIFFTTKNNLISGDWVSAAFRRLAAHSGVQKRLRRNLLKLRAHKTRHLLKSILLECECSEWAADHVIGHKAKDPYTVSAKLFPERLREEYAKASHKINLLSCALVSVVDHSSDDDYNNNDNDSSNAANPLEKDNSYDIQDTPTPPSSNTKKQIESVSKADNADAESKLNMMVMEIINALNDPGNDLRENLRARLGGIV